MVTICCPLAPSALNVRNQGHDGSRRRSECKLSPNAAHANCDASASQSSDDALLCAPFCLGWVLICQCLPIWRFVLQLIIDCCLKCAVVRQCSRHSNESMQGLLLELVQRVAESSPVTVIGESMWGDEAGSVYILQVSFFRCARFSFSERELDF
jgi:hypothetical protein